MIRDEQKDRYLAVKYQVGKYFGDPLTQSERNLFALLYKNQIHPILQQVEPVDEKGNGVVQLRNWLYKSPPEDNPTSLEAFPEEQGISAPFIRYVTKPWNDAKDFSQEAWIAQENMWIQREIYDIIRKTNDSLSIFQRKDGQGFEMTGKEAQAKDKALAFTNPYFEVSLVRDSKNNNLLFTIKNRLPRRQRLDLSFAIQTSNKPGMKPEIIKVSGLPLFPAGDKANKDTLVQTIPPPKDTPREGIYSVSQVLTWETAAVKRIDQISIGSNGGDVDGISHSQRTFYDSLRPFDDKDIGKDDAAAAGPGGGPPPMKGGSTGKNAADGTPGGPKKAAGIGQNVGVLAHGLWRDRYVEVTAQSRRIPVAVVLIVDQDHVDRVLTQFNNSTLRFLETQVLLNHYPGSLQPPTAVDPKDGAATPGNPFRMKMPGFGPGAGPAAGPGGQPQPSAGQDMETNMEIVIYGIMTLYQRHPPRAAASMPGPATAPAATPAPLKKGDR